MACYRNYDLEGIYDNGMKQRDIKLAQALLSGMPHGAAASSAGVAPCTAYKIAREPKFIEYMRAARAESERRTMMTRDKVVKGLQDAIKDAKLTSDPTAQIAGWREIARIFGYYEPEKKVIEVSNKTEEALEQLKEVTMDQLMELVGDDALDGEFTLVREPERLAHGPQA